MKKLLALAAALAAFAFITPAVAQSVGASAGFSKGSAHFSVTGGSGYAFDHTYLVLGAGASYYLTDGLAVGLNVESWTGADPGLLKLTPSVTYVFHQVRTVKPYVGAFYRRTYIDDLPDLDSLGARAGIYVPVGRNAFLGVGGVYETYSDCKPSVYRKCDATYVEFSLTFAF